MSHQEEEISPNKSGSGLMIAVGIVLFVVSIGMQKLYDFDALREGQPLLKLFDINIPVIVGTLGLVILLWGVIKSFYTTPLWDLINQRNHSLNDTFSEAESLRNEMVELKADYEKRLAATEAEAREKIQAQVKEAQELKKSLTAEAQAKADDMKAAAAAEIEAERKKVLSELRVHVATLSLQASEKIIKENMDTTRNRALIDDFLKTVEVKN